MSIFTWSKNAMTGGEPESRVNSDANRFGNKACSLSSKRERFWSASSVDTREDTFASSQVHPVGRVWELSRRGHPHCHCRLRWKMLNSAFKNSLRIRRSRPFRQGDDGLRLIPEERARVWGRPLLVLYPLYHLLFAGCLYSDHPLLAWPVSLGLSRRMKPWIRMKKMNFSTRL